MFEAIVALLIGGLAGTLTELISITRESQKFWDLLEAKLPILVKVLEPFGIKRIEPRIVYQDRVSNLLRKFSEITTETNNIIVELERELESKSTLVGKLEEEHKELTEHLERLKQSPEFGHIQTMRLLEKMNKEQVRDSRSSAWRDYILYALGVITPFILGWIASKFDILLPF